ncbi:DUF4328 domain-containing protein, partial [Streptomyces sp. HC44]
VHVSPPPTTTPTLRSIRGLSIALAVLLAVYVLALLLRTAVLSIVQSELSTTDGASTTELIAGFDYLMAASLAAELLTAIVGTAVVNVWAVWFHRTRINAEAFAPGRIRHASWLAAGSWFIPVVNLYLPKRIGNDIWTATTGRSAGAGRWLLHTWWWCWLAYFLAYANDSLVSWYDRDYVGAATDTILTSQTANAIGTVAAVLAICYVRRLSSRQQSRIEGTPGPQHTATARTKTGQA